jgi:hypothetical protein
MVSKVEIDTALETLSNATRDELREMMVSGAFFALRRTQADLAEGKPGAKKAERKAIQDLLGMFTNAVLNGEIPDQRLIEFMAGQYREVQYGGDARKAFPHVPYKPNDPKEVRGKQLSMEVWFLRGKDREKLSRDRAITEVVEQHPGLSEDNLRTIFQRYSLPGYAMAFNTSRPPPKA